MVRTIPCLFFAVAVSAQDCQIPPEISSLTVDQVRAQVAGGRDDFFLYQRWIDVPRLVPSREFLPRSFRKSSSSIRMTRDSSIFMAAL